LFQNRDRGRLVIDEDASLTARGNFASQDDGIAFGIESIVFEDAGDGLRGTAFDLKHRRNYRPIGTGTDHVRRGLLPEKQAESVDQNGFASAGFAREQVQARGERYRQVLDHRVVLEAQFD
jgi:hypothetical protein